MSENMLHIASATRASNCSVIVGDRAGLRALRGDYTHTTNRKFRQAGTEENDMTTPEIMDAQRRLADAVNGDIKLSVPWRSVKGIGSTAKICHIQIEFSLQSGSLRRRGGDLLCGAKLKTLEPAEACDSAGRPYMQEIDCRACLKRADTLSRIIILTPEKLKVHPIVSTAKKRCR